MPHALVALQWCTSYAMRVAMQPETQIQQSNGHIPASEWLILHGCSGLLVAQDTRRSAIRVSPIVCKLPCSTLD